MAKKQKFMKHIMTGISYMIPIVVAGGILGALAKAFGGWDIGSAVAAGATPFSNLNPFTWVGFWWGVNKLSSYAMDFAVAVMTAGAAYSMAGRPGIVPGLIIGYCSAQSKAGFLGGLLMAFIIGNFVNWMKTWKLPQWCEGLMPVMFIPVISTLVCGMTFLCVFSIPLAYVDVIINTSGNEIRDERVVSLEGHLREQGIEAVRQKVNQIFYFRKKQEFHFNSLCHQLFEVDLFLIRPRVENKDQLIAMMVEKLVKKGDVTANYLESVFDRERATTTSIGRGVAIPHGNMTEINESRIVVAILDRPISWHGDMVEVVFLLAVKMTSKFEIKRTKQFYKDFLQLTDNDESLEAVKKMDSALDIYQYFIK